MQSVRGESQRMGCSPQNQKISLASHSSLCRSVVYELIQLSQNVDSVGDCTYCYAELAVSSSCCEYRQRHAGTRCLTNAQTCIFVFSNLFSPLLCSVIAIRAFSRLNIFVFISFIVFLCRFLSEKLTCRWTLFCDFICRHSSLFYDYVHYHIKTLGCNLLNDDYNSDLLYEQTTDVSRINAYNCKAFH